MTEEKWNSGLNMTITGVKEKMSYEWWKEWWDKNKNKLQWNVEKMIFEVME